jgi:hypothetical protein
VHDDCPLAATIIGIAAALGVVLLMVWLLGTYR